MSLGGSINPRMVLLHKLSNLHRYIFLMFFILSFLSLHIPRTQYVTWNEQDESKWEKLTKKKLFVGL